MGIVMQRNTTMNITVMQRKTILGWKRITTTIASVLAAQGSCHGAVQIIRIHDSNVAAAQPFAGSGAFQTLTDSFCVISTVGTVKLTFVNSSGADAATRSWKARNAAGESVRYRQYVALSGDTNPILISDPAATPLVVPLMRAARSAEGCGAGNVVKGIVPVDAIPARNSYQDVVSVGVTPL